jgi:uncharacterized BrkB/YihY/UPF0761 family membrane protein
LLVWINLGAVLTLFSAELNVVLTRRLCRAACSASIATRRAGDEPDQGGGA